MAGPGARAGAVRRGWACALETPSFSTKCPPGLTPANVSSLLPGQRTRTWRIAAAGPRPKCSHLLDWLRNPSPAFSTRTISVPLASTTLTRAPMPSRAPRVASSLTCTQSFTAPDSLCVFLRNRSMGAVRLLVHVSRSPSPSQSTGTMARASSSKSKPDAALTVANRPPPEPAVFRKHTFRSCPLSEKPRSSKSSTPRMDLR